MCTVEQRKQLWGDIIKLEIELAAETVALERACDYLTSQLHFCNECPVAKETCDEHKNECRYLLMQHFRGSE